MKVRKISRAMEVTLYFCFIHSRLSLEVGYQLLRNFVVAGGA
jgi:hypothetical protein